MSIIAACSDALIVLGDGSLACSGAWQQIDTVATLAPFDPATMLDPAIVAQAFGAGFVFTGGLMLIGVGARLVLSVFR